MTAVLETISVWAIPVVIAAVSLYAICKKFLYILYLQKVQKKVFPQQL